MKKIEELEKKLKDQEEKHAKDKKFYEEALDKRFDQMEEWEEKAHEEERKNQELQDSLEAEKSLHERRKKECDELKKKIKGMEEDINSQQSQMNKPEN